jgi:hypothetical protein
MTGVSGGASENDTFVLHWLAENSSVAAQFPATTHMSGVKRSDKHSSGCNNSREAGLRADRQVSSAVQNQWSTSRMSSVERSDKKR